MSAPIRILTDIVRCDRADPTRKACRGCTHGRPHERMLLCKGACPADNEAHCTEHLEVVE